MIRISILFSAAAALALAIWAGPVAAQKTDFDMRLGAAAKCDKAHPIKLDIPYGSVESCVLRENARFAWSQGMQPTWCAAGKLATFYQGWVTSCTMARDWEFPEEPGRWDKPIKPPVCKAGRIATIDKDRKRLESCK